MHLFIIWCLKRSQRSLPMTLSAGEFFKAWSLNKHPTKFLDIPDVSFFLEVFVSPRYDFHDRINSIQF